MTTLVFDPNTGLTRPREFHEHLSTWKELSPLEKAEKRSESFKEALLKSNVERKKLKQGHKQAIDVINGLAKLMETGQELRKKFETEANAAKKSLQDKLGGQIVALNERILDLQAALRCMQAMGKEVAEAVIEWGDHKSECNVVELRISGRLVSINEEDACTCGWTEFEKKLLGAKEYVVTGQLKDEDIKQVLREFRK